MKSTFKKTLAALLLAAPIMAGASGGGHYPHVELDPRDQVSLQRGAQIFVNNCLSCHSAAVMQAHMNPADAKKWFGTVPPDLTLIARSRGNDYIYAYLRGFYKDPTRPTGWNNTVLPNAAMPHVLAAEQGIQAVKLDAKGQPVMKKDAHGKLVPDLQWESAGKLTRFSKDGKFIETDYNNYARDLTNFMAYMAEPAQVQRKQIGYIVLMFLLAVLLPLSYFLKKEYWKDVH